MLRHEICQKITRLQFLQLWNIYWIRNIDKVKREKHVKNNTKYGQEYLANLKFISFVRTTELHLSQAWNAPFSAAFSPVGHWDGPLSSAGPILSRDEGRCFSSERRRRRQDQSHQVFPTELGPGRAQHRQIVISLGRTSTRQFQPPPSSVGPSCPSEDQHTGPWTRPGVGWGSGDHQKPPQRRQPRCRGFYQVCPVCVQQDQPLPGLYHSRSGPFVLPWRGTQWRAHLLSCRPPSWHPVPPCELSILSWSC